MKASKFTEAQIAFVLRQAEERTPVAEVCRKAGCESRPNIDPARAKSITRLGRRSASGPLADPHVEPCNRFTRARGFVAP
ncbi:hypothetical protein ABIF66_011651 [Bradyrhizobium japonicum]